MQLFYHCFINEALLLIRFGTSHVFIDGQHFTNRLKALS